MPQVELRNVVVIDLHYLRRIQFVETIEQFVLRVSFDGTRHEHVFSAILCIADDSF